MAETFFDLTKPGYGMNYRWVQPPQIAYFVTTIDARGNVNSTPVTLGTCVGADMEPDACGNVYYVFTVGYSELPNLASRHAYHNLCEVPQCVISYIGGYLAREAEVACLPLPEGISEIDVAGLTELPSHKVRPPGIVEAKVNIEAEVVSSCPVGKYQQLFVCRVLGVAVDADLIEQDNQSEWHAGVLALDPLYELNILRPPNRPPRLHTIQLDHSRIRPMAEDFGPTREWVGSFEDWLDDEQARGRLTAEEHQRILTLHQAWLTNPDPEANAEIRGELTRALRELCAPDRGRI